MKEKKTKINGQIIYFISYLCLVCGILLSAVKFTQTNTPKAAVFIVALLAGTGLFLAWAKGKKAYPLTEIILFGIAGYFVIKRLPLFFPIRKALPFFFPVENFSGRGDFLAEAAFLLSLFCFFLIFIARKGWLFYGFTFSVLLLGPIYGCHLDILEVLLLLLFHLGDSVYRTVFFEKKEREKKQFVQSFTAGQGMLISAAFLFAAFFAAVSIPKLYRKNWMEESARLQKTLENLISQKSQRETPVNPGIVSRKNNYPSGNEELEIQLSVKPDDSLYLKNYIASSYLGNQWKKADETGFYEKIRENTQFSQYYTSPSYFERRQFEAVHYGKIKEWRNESRNWKGMDSVQMLDDYRKWSRMETITIKPLSRKERGTFYIPYVSSYNSRNSEGSYSFSWYPWKDYLLYQDQAKDSPLLWLDDMEEAYQNFVREEYLSVPKDLLPRLWELCRRHPVSSEKEATAFILKTLNEQASYSLTPGFMPYRTDVAEYFLFEGKSGYCQHFATAAALMYRMYGIPSRYVTGYLADPGDFLLQEDGSYRAVLTDRQAHAWVEIYLDGLGWIPVEATPPSEELYRSAGGNHVQPLDQEENEEGEDAEELDKEKEENALSVIQERTNEEENREEDILNREVLETLPEESEHTKYSGKDEQKKLIWAVWAGILFFSIIFAKWTVSRRTRQLCPPGADEVYQKIVLLLKTNGKLSGWNGMEQGFAQAAAKEWKEIPAEELKRIQKIAMDEAFGRELPCEQEKAEVRAKYPQIYRRIARQLKGKEKLKFCLHNLRPGKEREKRGDKQGKSMDGTQCS